jgi:Zn-dependent protease
MLPTRKGAIHLFRAFGIDVFLHWSWFLVAVIELQGRDGRYDSPMWSVNEYLSLFIIVLLHEFGHSLACHSVGGKADEIVLWPLGGVAYVQPPQRPGAVLWSIVAGPLVNVVLAVFFFFAVPASEQIFQTPDARHWVQNVAQINLYLLIFNVLPIYPLDGGKILHALLWFVLGRARSLQIATAIGFAGAAGFAWLVLGSGHWNFGQTWGLVLIFFLVSNCWRGWQQARALLVLAAVPKHEGLSCPSCHVPPPAAPYWRCLRCQHPFDPFASNAVCPNCQAQYAEIWCLECAAWAPIEEWAQHPRV